MQTLKFRVYSSYDTKSIGSCLEGKEMNFGTFSFVWSLLNCSESDFSEYYKKLLMDAGLSCMRTMENIEKEFEFIVSWMLEDIIQELPRIKEVIGPTHIYDIAVFFDGTLETGRSFEGRLDDLEEHAEERKIFQRRDSSETETLDFTTDYLFCQYLLGEKEKCGLPDSLCNVLMFYSLSKLLAQKAICHDAELIVKDMAAAIVDQLPNTKKHEGEAWLWVRADFEDGKYTGGSTFWIPAEEEKGGAVKSAKRK
jgi:hypothetical protein